MRIDSLHLENFKKFKNQTIELHPHFTLLVGDNGSGKTTVLDALAVSLGVWLVEVPDSTLHNSRRNIEPTEIRLESSQEGDRVQFRERLPVVVRASGGIGVRKGLTWTRQIKQGGHRTTNSGAKEVIQVIGRTYESIDAGEQLVCPVLAYYGAGRAWLPSNQRMQAEAKAGGPARRWAAFYDCFNERIRFDELRRWFHRETTAAGARGGPMRPGYEVVKRSVLNCVPNADRLWFDPDREQIVLSIGGNALPFDNLSAGQRMMLALVADLAIKAVTQNAHLLPPDVLGPDDEPLPRVLANTPGVVLIDEIDVHLHPRWQRRVATDLKRTFPAIQFVCTSHSPQVIGELMPDELRMLDDEMVTIPERSFGIDSSRLLDELMHATSRNPELAQAIRELFERIDAEDFAAARAGLVEIEAKLGPNDPDMTRARNLISFLEQAG